MEKRTSFKEDFYFSRSSDYSTGHPGGKAKSSQEESCKGDLDAVGQGAKMHLGCLCQIEDSMSTVVGLDTRVHSYPPTCVWNMGMGRCLFQGAGAR